MGQPAWGFPEDLQKVVLKGEKPITCRPGELLEPVDFDKVRGRKCSWRSSPDTDMTQRHAAYCLYPKVVRGLLQARARSTAIIMRMGSHVFFNGMALGETNKINIEDGKTLVIKYLGLGDLNEDGTRTVSFELNGMRREVAVPDKQRRGQRRQGHAGRSRGQEPGGRLHPRHGQSKINVKAGDTVEENQVLAVIEAMKMETSVVARMAGKVEVHSDRAKAARSRPASCSSLWSDSPHLLYFLSFR